MQTQSETTMTTMAPPALSMQDAFMLPDPSSPRKRRPSLLDDEPADGVARATKTDSEEDDVLVLPPKYHSAPASRRASRPQSASRLARALSFGRATSQPVSPTKAVKRHVPAAHFGTAPKSTTSHIRPSLCPVSSYAPLSSTLKTTGSVPFGSKTPEKKPDACDVGAYMSPRSTLKRSGSATFGTAPLRRSSSSLTHGPEVHSYAPVESTLRKTGATAFGRARSRDNLFGEGSSAPVSSYSGMYSSFSLKGGTMAKYGRQDQAWTKRAMCPSHSYGALTSSLKTSGVAAFPKAGMTLKPSLPPLPPAVAAC